MKEKEAKQELVERYKYIYRNAMFILAPYMREQSEEEFKKLNKTFNGIIKKPAIFFDIDGKPIVSTLEKFLLSDVYYEESELYKYVESKKKDKEYLEQVKIGLELLEKCNEGKEYFITKLDEFKILSTVYDYVQDQSGDLSNKSNKLRILDEYCKLSRYKNDGKIRFSGRNRSIEDCESVSINLNSPKPSRDKNDVGVKSNTFIKGIIRLPYNQNNRSIFTEIEKQDVYLLFHDELRRDLEIKCDTTSPSTISGIRIRPEGTEPCDTRFYIREEDIFVKQDVNIFRYYQVCPYCGYIVNIPNEILTNGVINRIEKRCEKDPNLFRKEYLYSELKQLDDRTPFGLRKVLKK